MQSNVYILYTGGTFGMKKSEEYGLQPSSWDEIIEYLPAVKKQNFFSYFKEINFTFETLHPIIDSSDITPETWHHIAEKIQKNYASHDGFYNHTRYRYVSIYFLCAKLYVRELE